MSIMNMVKNIKEIHPKALLLFDVRNNYYVDEKFENRNLNKYDTVFEKAYLYVRKQRKIRKINEKLMEQIDSADFKDVNVKNFCSFLAKKYVGFWQSIWRGRAPLF